MNASLFFLCPTDCLESIVNKNYKGKNYFYTCLGNNSSFDSILLESIRNIYFVLSEQNKIVVDAMEGQTLPQISGLQNLFNAIKLNKRQSKLFWKTSDSVHPVLSYYLNQKIIQLQANLSCTITQGLTLQGKIYIKSQNKFIDTYPDLVCLRKYSLN